MIKHRKIIICILLCYALFVVGIFNVNAKTIDTWTSGNNTSTYGALTCTELAGMESCFRSGITYQNDSQFTFLLGNTNSVTNADVFVTIYTPFGYNDNGSVNISLQDGGICFLQGVYHSGWNNYKCSNVTGRLIFVVSKGAGVGGSGTSVIGVARLITYYEYLDNTTITNNTSDINNKISDSSIDTDNTDRSVGGFSSSVNSSMNNTPVSSMISLPITFLTGVNNALSNSCTNVNYIELFDYQLVLPCLNLSDRLGSVWTIIDTICSCMLIFSIGKSLVGTFARLSDMDTNIMYECYANGTKHRGEGFDD